MKDFIARHPNKKIIIFGAGNLGKKSAEELPQNAIAYCIDNDNNKWGKWLISGKVLIEEPTKLQKEDKEGIVIVVASMYYPDISIQLQQMGFSENQHFYDARQFDEHIASQREPAQQALYACMDILEKRQGYLRSIESKLPIAADGLPIPWYTYPAIEYFNRLDAKGLNIFEFGCGQSSLYWASKGAKVWCVEHDQEWFETMQSRGSSLQGIKFCTDKISYAQAILDSNIQFDIVIIDGIWRNECAAAALERIRAEGVIIVDNSDWYTDVTSFLRTKGYFPIDFNGFGPCNPYCWTTTLMLPFSSHFMERQGEPVPIGGIQVSKDEKW